LCASEEFRSVLVSGEREYFRCEVCDLTFMDPMNHMGPEDEKARYEKHQNSPHDQGYRDFLDRMLSRLILHLTPGASGLDFGCGPGPTVSVMMRERGFSCEDYDPIFHDFPTLLEREYDFVTSTETVEHFHHPAEAFQTLISLVCPGGWIGIMTEILTPGVQFETWYYRLDFTHVSFYSRTTLNWIATHHGLEQDTIGSNVVIYHKPG